MSPELIQLIAQFNNLSDSERSQLVMGLQAAQEGSLSQFNSDKSNGWQTHMEDGVLYCANTIHNYVNNTIHNYEIPEDLIPNLVNALSEQMNLIISESDYYNENSNTIDLEYGSENTYTPNYYNPSGNYDNLNLYSSIPRLLMSGGLVLCAGIVLLIIFMTTQNKEAVVNISNGANVRDDSGVIKYDVPYGTKVKLTGKRDGDYCQTDRGWIYCLYLNTEKSDGSIAKSIPNNPKSNQSVFRVAIVKPEADKNAARLRTQPNAGPIKGYVVKDKEVQVIQCIQDGCEVNDGFIQGWIYKPFLRFK